MIIEISTDVAFGDKEKNVITGEEEFVESGRYTRSYKVFLDSISHWNDLDEDGEVTEIHLNSGFTIPIQLSVLDFEQMLISKIEFHKNDLEEEEIVAVLAHEVGHYKRKHILFNLVTSILLSGLTLYILSIFISNPLLSNAIGVETPSFHVGLIAFGLLYSPISEITGLIMNYVSRVFEYQADDYDKNTYKAEPLITSLKKLSKNSLSNLTPHKAYVFMHYSHPTLLDRIKNLRS